MITTATIDGMRTEYCKRAVFTALAMVPGITRADVQLGSVVLEHDGSATPALIRDAVAVAGYTVVNTMDDRRTLPLLMEDVA